MCPSSHRGAVVARVAKVLLQRTCKKGAAASTVGFRAPADHAKPRPTRNGDPAPVDQLDDSDSERRLSCCGTPYTCQRCALEGVSFHPT